MCQFNSGCPGHEVDDGFVPCTEETGCVSGVDEDECLTVTLDRDGRPSGLVHPPYQSKYITL